MKIEEKLKNKYLYKKGFNIFKFLYFISQRIKYSNFYKKSYSTGAQDLIINYYFKEKQNGIYIDVGCFHPFKGNNTKLLYDKGWSGINIDLDFHTIELFEHIRKRDENIHAAISETEEEKELYFFHNRSAINSLDRKRKISAKEVKKIKTLTLNSILEKSKFKNKKINLLLIDVEGHELEVIKSINLERYLPEMVIIESLDDNLSKLEFSNQNINTVLSSAIYKHMTSYNYHFVNWLHSDLVFVHSSVRG